MKPVVCDVSWPRLGLCSMTFNTDRERLSPVAFNCNCMKSGQVGLLGKPTWNTQLRMQEFGILEVTLTTPSCMQSIICVYVVTNFKIWTKRVSSFKNSEARLLLMISVFLQSTVTTPVVSPHVHLHNNHGGQIVRFSVSSSMVLLTHLDSFTCEQDLQPVALYMCHHPSLTLAVNHISLDPLNWACFKRIDYQWKCFISRLSLYILLPSLDRRTCQFHSLDELH